MTRHSLHSAAPRRTLPVKIIDSPTQDPRITAKPMSEEPELVRYIATHVKYRDYAPRRLDKIRLLERTDDGFEDRDLVDRAEVMDAAGLCVLVGISPEPQGRRDHPPRDSRRPVHHRRQLHTRRGYPHTRERDSIRSLLQQVDRRRLLERSSYAVLPILSRYAAAPPACNPGHYTRAIVDALAGQLPTSISGQRPWRGSTAGRSGASPTTTVSAQRSISST